ncbi:MAG TPA: sarcosine oxidase subunit alpha family protein, partial [Stellaceae bacterium]|nr:sarcosine oxidase subunit alpha family protein [Stellaceae bacterium]
MTMRLASGGLIDRFRPLSFTFDGRRMTGFAGDTLASALIANGVSLVGRSFKYHRPRGVLTAGSEEPNALVELRRDARREPNVKATSAELYDGLEARSQNRWPSLDFDLMSWTAPLSPLLAAGFYYKTFMWPAAFWETIYEPLIRRAAGLGRAAALPDPDRYEKCFAFCDVLVIGAGPAGLIAARAAARSGARVIHCDEDFVLGGRLLAERLEIDGIPGAAWAGQVVEELAGAANVTLMPRTTVFGSYDHGVFGALERVADHFPEPPPYLPRQRLWQITAKRTILASGAVERPIAFAGNDLPGIMLAGAVRTYVNRFGALPGRRVAVFTNNDDGWKTVETCAAAGMTVAAVIDSRPDPAPALRSAAEQAGAAVMAGAQVREALGGRHLSAVEIARADGTVQPLDIDLLAVSGGWNPSMALASHRGTKPLWDEVRGMHLPGPRSGMSVAGAVAGHWTLGACLRAGTLVGTSIATDCGFDAPKPPVPEASPESDAITKLWQVPGGRKKSFVDFQNDVTIQDIEIAHREGFRSVEHLKRYTTLGMATDQGRLANTSGLAIMAALTGRSIPETGTTTYRPPYTPVAIAAFAGPHRHQNYRPTRRLPAHRWSAEQGASFATAGLWLRPEWYARPGEAGWKEIVGREVRAVRSGVGLADVSTLGKIDVQGGDAAVFLDRIYCNPIASLPVGKARYGLMLREDGIVMDDGTVSRLGPQHFLLSTTSAGAEHAMEHLEFSHQVLWPTLDVQMVAVTEQWAQFSIAGPRSRETLERVVDPGNDLSNAALPFLGVVELTVGDGIPARLFRISFSGELAYELAVPARHGEATARAIAAAGAEFGLAPYGLEALLVMRLEKGFVSSDEIDGSTTARDLGLGKMMSQKKDYVGRVLAGRPALVAVDRPAIAGVKPVDRAARFNAGAHLLPLDGPATGIADLGHITSAAWSPTLGHWIGLCLVKGGPARHGERL